MVHLIIQQSPITDSTALWGTFNTLSEALGTTLGVVSHWISNDYDGNGTNSTIRNDNYADTVSTLTPPQALGNVSETWERVQSATIFPEQVFHFFFFFFTFSLCDNFFHFISLFFGSLCMIFFSTFAVQECFLVIAQLPLARGDSSRKYICVRRQKSPLPPSPSSKIKCSIPYLVSFFMVNCIAIV